MERLGFAFAGLRHGHIYAMYNALSTQPEAQITGWWEEDAEAADEAEKRFAARRYSSLDELLGDPSVDTVCIGDCFGKRGGVALKALRAGKHVLADKPLCTSLMELEAIRREAGDRNLAVGIMLDLRDHPNAVTAARLLKEGKLGTVNNVLYEGQHPLMYGSRPSWYFEDGMHGGVINDIAIHGVDYVRQVTGAELEKVEAARCWNFFAAEEPGFRDSAQLMLRLKGGIGVLGDCSYAAPTSHGYTHSAYWHMRFWGEKGMLEFSYNSEGVRLYLENEPVRVVPGEAPASTWLTRFLDAVRCGSRRTVFSDDNLLSQQETLLIQEAADRR